MRINCGASSYYITLAARDPDSGLQEIFQVLVDQERLGSLDLTCTIARPRGKDVTLLDLWCIIQYTITSNNCLLMLHSDHQGAFPTSSL